MDNNITSLNEYLENQSKNAFSELESYGFNFSPNQNQKTPAEQLIQFALVGEVTLEKDSLITKIAEEIKQWDYYHIRLYLS